MKRLLILTLVLVLISLATASNIIITSNYADCTKYGNCATIKGTGNNITNYYNVSNVSGGGIEWDKIVNGTVALWEQVMNGTLLTTESDTLQSVTDRGLTTTNSIIVGGINDTSGIRSIDPNNRILYANDGTTPIVDWSGASYGLSIDMSTIGNPGMYINGNNNYPVVDIFNSGTEHRVVLNDAQGYSGLILNSAFSGYFKDNATSVGICTYDSGSSIDRFALRINGDTVWETGNILDNVFSGNSAISIDPNNRILYYSDGVTQSVNYGAGKLKYSGGKTTVDYEYAKANDVNEYLSMDWNIRCLYNLTGACVLNWTESVNLGGGITWDKAINGTLATWTQVTNGTVGGASWANIVNGTMMTLAQSNNGTLAKWSQVTNGTVVKQIDNVSFGTLSTSGFIGINEINLSGVVYVNSTSGYVGMGTTKPAFPLHVNNSAVVGMMERYDAGTTNSLTGFAGRHTTSGDMADGFGTAVNYAIQDNAGVNNYIGNLGMNRDGNDSSGKFVVMISSNGVSSQRFTINSTGVINSSPTYSVTVGGTNRDLYIDNTGIIGYVSSSIAGKENIRSYTDTSWIYNLSAKIYDRKNSTTKNEVGLIAEEVVYVNPDLVSYKRNESYGNCKVTVDGEYVCDIIYTETTIPETVSYSKLVVPILIEVQNLKKFIDDILNRLTGAEQEIDDLQTENQRIKDCLKNTDDFKMYKECVLK